MTLRRNKTGYAHDRAGCAQQRCTRDIGILSRLGNLYHDRLLTVVLKKKKKKGHLGLGRHSIVSEPRFINT